MPFILRGVNLLGINSVADAARRAARGLAAHRDRPAAAAARPHLHESDRDFDELPAQFDDYIKGRVTGRTVVRIP